MSKRTMNHWILLAAAAVSPLALAATASAIECASDADCADGEYCAMACAEPACPPGEECPEPDCTGECVGLDDGMGWSECETDADCGEGWLCRHETSEMCTDTACPEGAECPDTEPACETYEYSYCEYDLQECEADSDCDDGFVCLSYSYDECPPVAMPDCAPGSDCPEPEPVECTTVSEAFCAPRYIAPCEADADCGDGFTCVEAQSCWCSGGGGTSGGSSGGEIPPDAGAGSDPGAPDSGAGSGSSIPGEPTPGDDVPADDCGCEPTGTFYCEPEVIECDADSDCPTDWTCMSGDVSSAPCTFDEATGETFCPEPVEGASYCAPPAWGVWGMGAGSADGGYAEAAADATGASRGEEGGAGGGSTNTDDSVLEIVGDGAGGGSSDEGGCTASPNRSSGFGLLGLVGLVAAFRRRRSA